MAERITESHILETTLDMLIERDIAFGSTLTPHEGTLQLATMGGQEFIITVKEV